jgi:uncharacterized Zn finger protein
VLQLVGIGGRLQRGKNYARTGQVISMEIAPGKVTASVQGSRAKPYSLSIETKVLSALDWDAAEAVMESSAIFMATLLAGDMPEDIEEAFAVSSSPLFPASARDFDSECSCPDWENPCKHIAAVYFLLAEAFDDDPFLIFAWRGRTKAELLANLRGRRRPSGRPDHSDGLPPIPKGSRPLIPHLSGVGTRTSSQSRSARVWRSLRTGSPSTRPGTSRRRCRIDHRITPSSLRGDDKGRCCVGSRRR